MKLFKLIYEKDFNLNIFFLKSVFFITFLFVTFNFFYWVSERSVYEYTDWLTNYQGGFVRRGLFGEIFYNLHSISGVGLDHVVLLCVILMYFFLFYYLYKQIINIKLNFINTLVVLSPLSFTYLGFSKTLAGRKEVLFFLLISIFFSNLKKIKFEQVKYWIIFILIISSLTHLGFIFYIPFLVLFFIFLYPDKNFNEISIQIAPIIIVMIIIFTLMFYSATFYKPDIELICRSIQNFTNKCPEETYLRVFELSFSDIFAINSNFMKNYYFVKYPIYYILSFFPIYYAFFNLQNVRKYKSKKLLILLILGSFCTLPVFVLGADYGRYLQWQYFCYLLIFIYIINSKILVQNNKNNFFKFKVNYLFLSTVIFFYSFFWTVPHCCDKKYSFLFDKIFLKIFLN